MGEENMNGPTLLREGGFSEEDLGRLKKQQNIFKIVDLYHGQSEELFRILKPGGSDAELATFIADRPSGDMAGSWVYYPWSGTLLHTLNQDDLFNLRTNRNQLLITKEEQQKLRHTVVGIAGMSVGAGMALSLTYSGTAQTIKLADFDELDTTNLNRLRETLGSVGQQKATLAAQHIYELDPFSDIKVFEGGLNDDNLEEFFSEPRLDVVIDEIDDFKMKVKLRQKAKEQGIPVLMFSSLGDNILIDIERFDVDGDLPIFHGLLGSLADEITNNPNITPEDEKRYAVLIVGKEYVPTRALATLEEMGRTLVGRPQLYSTIAIDGGLAAYLVRKIIIDNKPNSGRYFVKFGQLFELDDDDLIESAERNNIIKRLLS